MIHFSAAFVLFSLFLVAPGYVLGWGSNIFEFRERQVTTQATLGISTLALSSIFLFDLLSNRDAVSTEGALLVFEVRPLAPIQWVFQRWEFLAPLKHGINLLVLPVNYFIELGFFLVAVLLFL